jgi:bifunctional non-homologous end joining protein LigD
MVPIEPSISHDEARDYCRRMAYRIVQADQRRYTISPAPEKRGGRIYIDYLRNGRGNTAIGAYSPRARQGFPIAAPVTWRDVERGIKPDAFSMNRLPKRRRT